MVDLDQDFVELFERMDKMQLADDPEQALQCRVPDRRFPGGARQPVTGQIIRTDAIISPIQAEKTGYQGKTSFVRQQSQSFYGHMRGTGTEQKGKIE